VLACIDYALNISHIISFQMSPSPVHGVEVCCEGRSMQLHVNRWMKHVNRWMKMSTIQRKSYTMAVAKQRKVVYMPKHVFFDDLSMLALVLVLVGPICSSRTGL
jgi:hypothetical protein